MSGVFSVVMVAILAILITVAAGWDVRTRTVPNSLNAAIALLAVPFWWASGYAPWPDMAIQLGIGAGVLILFFGAFMLGAMGGGDVKLVAAVALWLPLQAVLMMLIIMSLAGGVLTLFMLVRHRLAKAKQPLEIPYAVAIAIGGFWPIGERFLNQFA